MQYGTFKWLRVTPNTEADTNEYLPHESINELINLTPLNFFSFQTNRMKLRDSFFTVRRNTSSNYEGFGLKSNIQTTWPATADRSSSSNSNTDDSSCFHAVQLWVEDLAHAAPPPVCDGCISHTDVTAARHFPLHEADTH